MRITDQENKEPRAEIIQGPWKKSKREVKLPDKGVIKLQETIDFVDDLTQTLVVQMIHTIKENEIDVEKESFVQNMSFVIEMVRASILKEMSLNNNMIKLMDVLYEIIFDSSSDIDDFKSVILKMREENNNGPEMV